MKTLLQPLQEINAYSSAKECIDRERLPMHISGCMDSQKAHFIYGLSKEKGWSVIVVQNEIKAREMLEDYKMFDKNVLYFPAKDVIFYSADVHGNAITVERLKAIQALLTQENGTIITTMDAGMEHLFDLSVYQRAMQFVTEGDTMDLENFIVRMIDMGYKRQSQVENPGDFSVRGGIADIFPITADCPYRVELWGDEIDTIRSFDVESQRSIERIESLMIFPASEFIVTKAQITEAFAAMKKDQKKNIEHFRQEKNHEAVNRCNEMIKALEEEYREYGQRDGLESFVPYFSIGQGSFFDYFDRQNTLFFVDDVQLCMEKAEAIETEFRESMEGRLEKGYILPKQMELLYSAESALAMLEQKRTIYLTMLDTLPKKIKVNESYALHVQTIGSYNKHYDLLIEDLKKWSETGYRVVVLSASRTRAERMSRDLNAEGVASFYRETLDTTLSAGQIMVSYGYLRKGFIYSTAKFVIVTEGDVFGAKTRTKRKRQKKYDGKVIQSFHDLNIGDYVVHENHGLGIYKGIEKVQVDRVAKDFVKIEYGDGGNLYVPVSGLNVLQKFASQSAKKPKLNKLNSNEWKKTKSRVRTAIQEIAKDLVLLYAKRQQMQGYAFSQDTPMQNEFEELFPYEETQDQLKAIEDTKRDMESTKIMDRLICGDVGYGKTEIALRAAFKAVNDSKQVAFLVPTTILAQQHYNTFMERLGDFPITVEMLSRFRTPAQQKKALERLKNGEVDIIIGTHRLLSKDVTFKNLGLLIVDEEQRFGVTHKERIKQMKGNVDVLTLSATPIPRTLHMSLVGIRDMSVLEEPPIDRLPIQTFVMEHNEEIIREAINRELARGGQVYYVYNRVRNIDEVTAEIMKMVPDANVAFAHGQMSERELENIMMAFINGEIDVLVATTIIETGLDISNVNTIIIDDADRMGLSQLYQLRGRVGRSNRTSYAFLMYKRDKALKEVAQKRLAAIREYTELGSGIKIAMRDLEIRGAGNLLGEAQSGHMEAVGYDLYCKMLNDAVRRLKGDPMIEEEFETEIDIQVEALIPAKYIPSEYQKLDMYKKIAEIQNEEDYRDMQEELIDRFGDIPKVTQNLLYIARIKAKAHQTGIEQIIQKPNGIRFFLHESRVVDGQKAAKMLKSYKEKLRYMPSEKPYFIYLIDQNQKKMPRTTRYTSGVAKVQKVKVNTTQELFDMIEKVIEDIGGIYEKNE